MVGNRGPKFDLIARASLRLSDASGSIKTHDLILDSSSDPASHHEKTSTIKSSFLYFGSSSNHSLPLFGHFCCRLAVQPDCVSSEQLCGYLKIVDHYHKKSKSFKSKIQEGHLYWGSLKNFTLSLWVKENQEISSSTIGRRSKSSSLKSRAKEMEPDVVIPIKKGIQMKRSSNSFSIICEDGQVFILSVLNKDDLQLWIVHIEQHVSDFIAWESIADTPMDILSPSPVSSSRSLGSGTLGSGVGSTSTLRTRAAGTLYDETSLSNDRDEDGSDSSENPAHHHSPIPSLRSPYTLGTSKPSPYTLGTSKSSPYTLGTFKSSTVSRNHHPHVYGQKQTQPSTIKSNLSSSAFFTRPFNGSTGSDSSSSPVLF